MKGAALYALALAGMVSFAQAQEADQFKTLSLQVACSPPANATAQQLHDAALVCDSFMRGLTQGMFVMQIAKNRGQNTCMAADQSLNRDQAKAALEAHLQKRPADLTGTAGVIAAIAILEAHPCH